MSAAPGVPLHRRFQPRRDTAWMECAACAGLPSEVFFPKQGERITIAARRVCEACDVTDACLAYALTQHEWTGIWGGMTPDERRRHLKRQMKTFQPNPEGS